MFLAKRLSMDTCRCPAYARASICNVEARGGKDGKYILYRRQHFTSLEVIGGRLFQHTTCRRHAAEELRVDDDTPPFSLLYSSDDRRVFDPRDYEVARTARACATVAMTLATRSAAAAVQVYLCRRLN
jgi:hypothetical protein